MNQSKLWTKDFIIMFVSTLFVSLTFFLLMTTLTEYAVEEFNASQSMAGLVSSIFIVGALVARLFAGKYIEIVGRKKMLYGGLGLFLVVMLSYFIVENMNILLLIRCLHGVAFGVFTTVIVTVVVDIIPNERKGEGISYFSLSLILAMAVGPFLGIYLGQQGNYTMIFAVCTLFSLIGSLILLLVPIPKADITKEQIEAMKEFKLKEFFEIKAIPISVMMTIMAFAYSGILSFINSYAIAINIVDAASFFFIVYAFFILISRPFTGRLLDKKGDNIVIYPALVLFVIGLVTLSQASQGFTLLLAGALIGLGYGTLNSCFQAIAIKESPRHRVGLANSTFLVFMDSGTGFGPFLIGFIIPIVGFRGLYLTLATLIFASIFLYYLLHGKKKRTEKNILQAS
ncbi:MFS transporter [Aquibacillus sediminis]|uniref:MFS transporter n=1 Tax=Aquibacillus sediminis TaxID=2574734 RepID=UPI0011088994|nr:MFS transporter [Aquibacillus sediminis]